MERRVPSSSCSRRQPTPHLRPTSLTRLVSTLCRFLSDLEENFENNIFTFQVCDVVLNHAPNFRRVYLPYVTNQTYQERTFQSLL